MLVMINMTGLKKTYWLPEFEFHNDKDGIWLWGFKFLFVDFSLFSKDAGHIFIQCANKWGSEKLKTTPSGSADLGDEEKPNGPSGAKVQMVLTAAMRNRLSSMNYTRAQIDAMRPEEAAKLIEAEEAK